MDQLVRILDRLGDHASFGKVDALLDPVIR
jgi:hypothetical protein